MRFEFIQSPRVPSACTLVILFIIPGLEWFRKIDADIPARCQRNLPSASNRENHVFTCESPAIV